MTSIAFITTNIVDHLTLNTVTVVEILSVKMVSVSLT